MQNFKFDNWRIRLMSRTGYCLGRNTCLDIFAKKLLTLKEFRSGLRSGFQNRLLQKWMPHWPCFHYTSTSSSFTGTIFCSSKLVENSLLLVISNPIPAVPAVLGEINPYAVMPEVENIGGASSNRWG